LPERVLDRAETVVNKDASLATGSVSFLDLKRLDLALLTSLLTVLRGVLVNFSDVFGKGSLGCKSLGTVVALGGVVKVNARMCRCLRGVLRLIRLASIFAMP
jgi:hypothetical protein